MKHYNKLFACSFLVLACACAEDKAKKTTPFDYKKNNANNKTIKDMDRVDMTKDLGEGMPDITPDLPPKMKRKIIDHSLFGNMPLDNRFKDPLFNGLGTSFDWFARQPSNPNSVTKVYRKEIWDSPTKMPVLHVLKTVEMPLMSWGHFIWHALQRMFPYG